MYTCATFFVDTHLDNIVPFYFHSGPKLAFCILSNTCTSMGIYAVSLLEIRGEGAQWNNFYREISQDDDFSLGYVFLMLIVDSIVYMLIAWCVNMC